MSQLPRNLSDRLGSARAGFADRLRATFSVGNLLGALRTLLWLAPLTILIWFTAESSQFTQKTVTVRLNLVAADTNRVAQLVEPADQTVRVQIRGPRALIDRVAPSDTLSMDLPLADATSPGLAARQAAPLLAQAPLFREARRVQILSTAPAELRVNVDEVVERRVPVTVPADVENLEAAVFDPPTVTIRGPAGVLREAERGGRLLAEASLLGLPVLRDPGKKDPFAVNVTTPLGPGVSVAPATVTAVVEVRETDVRLTVESMPVFVSVPAPFTDGFSVAVEPASVYNVPVIGAPRQVAMLRDKLFSPVARVEFTYDELNRLRDGQTVTKTPQFVLPDRVRVDQSTGEPIVVTCTARRRGD